MPSKQKEGAAGKGRHWLKTELEEVLRAAIAKDLEKVWALSSDMGYLLTLPEKNFLLRDNSLGAQEDDDLLRIKKLVDEIRGTLRAWKAEVAQELASMQGQRQRVQAYGKSAILYPFDRA